MIEMFAPSFLYSIAKDLYGRIARNRRRLTQSEIIALRTKWKTEFEKRLWKMHQEELRCDVIIRDMKRIDNYPNVDESRGISPWFRAGIVGTYHRGVLIGLSWEELTRDAGTKNWRKTNIQSEPAGRKVVLIGSIPYENIENADWSGDEYYNYLHLYVYFDFKKQPYQHVAYYEETTPHYGMPFYTEIATFQSVKRETEKKTSCAGRKDIK